MRFASCCELFVVVLISVYCTCRCIAGHISFFPVIDLNLLSYSHPLGATSAHVYVSLVRALRKDNIILLSQVL